MTTLEKTIQILFENDLVHTFEEFSEKWACKNKGWLAYTRCKGRDYSTDAAFNVLRETRKRKEKLMLVRRRMGNLIDEALSALTMVEALLKALLQRRHNIMECVFGDDAVGDKYI